MSADSFLFTYDFFLLLRYRIKSVVLHTFLSSTISVQRYKLSTVSLLDKLIVVYGMDHMNKTLMLLSHYLCHG